MVHDPVNSRPERAQHGVALRLEECKAHLIGVGALRDSDVTDRLLGTVAAHRPPAEERNTN
ncbi:MAG: hypothetical protein QOG20_4117 [Pseudonocardiales bacterium]|nr:hypothetical protein [Pseudonocardiales bacterium]